MKRSKIISLSLPLLLVGCVTAESYRHQTVYRQSMSRAQIEQTKIQMKQRQKIVQKNKSQNVYVHQDNRAYTGNAPGYAPAYGQNYYNAQKHAYDQRVYNQVQSKQSHDQPQASQSAEYQHLQAEQSRQAHEAQQMDLARQNSLNTKAQEDRLRQERAALESQQMDHARLESLRTHAQEQAQRHQESVQQAHHEAQAAAAPTAFTPPPAPPAPAPYIPPVYKPEKVQKVDQAQGGQVGKWKPSEGELVRAGDLVMGLKNDKGGSIPTHGEMQSHLQSSMGLSGQQADKVLGKLGI